MTTAMTSTSTVPEPASPVMEPSEHMRRIIVPLDGSPASEAILPLVESLAREPSTRLRLVRAVFTAPERSSKAETGGEASRYLARIGDELGKRGIHRVFRSVWHTRPEGAILRAAVGSGADIIALTAHGENGAGRLPLGHVAAHLLRHAPVPILLLLAGCADRRPEVGSILVPLDGAPGSTAILPVVMRLARERDRLIVLLRAVDPRSATTAETPAAERAAAAELAEIACSYRTSGLRIRWVVGVGPATDLILDVASQERAGLIAMATRPWGRLGSNPFGRVTSRVAALAGVPALVWRGYQP